LYINDARKRIKKIQAAITTPDFKILEFESHTLSSSAITHGNLKLHHLAKKIERFCQRGDYEKVLTYASSLSALANESFISLEKYRSTIKLGQESPEP
jgi:hypothetical protein